MKSKSDINIAIITSSYRPEITESLTQNCVSTLSKKGITKNQIEIFKVPGALEIPLTAKKISKLNKFDAIIAFGAVFKGDTYHFEQVSDECVRGCMKISYEFEIPVIYQVLSVYNPQDAIDRTTGTKDNRGVEGALSALQMIDLLKKINK